jgi:LacI family transcriptional regulator
MNAAAELGYQPNQVARAMRAGTTRTIGLVIIADFTNAFFDRATKGIVDEARAHGYQVLIANTDENLDIERDAIETLLEKQVDGLILVPSSPTMVEHMSDRVLRGRPLVLIDRRVEGSPHSTITTDDFHGCAKAVGAVVEKGHRRLGFLIASSQVSHISTELPAGAISTVADRVTGFKSGIAHAGVKGITEKWYFVEDAPEIAEDAAGALLDSSPRPSVLFTSNNDMALAVMSAAQKRGIRIGIDVSLVTVDDSPWAQAISPGITVISRPVDSLAKEAVSQLLAEIGDANTSTETVVLPTDIIMRDSVAPWRDES